MTSLSTSTTEVKVVFWQTDEHDQPAMVTERYEKAFTVSNITKEQEFYASELKLDVRLSDPDSGRTATVVFTVGPKDSFPKVFEKAVCEQFAPELEVRTKRLTDEADNKKAVRRFIDSLNAEVEWTHRQYVKDDEYIPHGEDIEAFLKREIGKPIICWEDSSQLGYEILPNKYFYRYVAPPPARDLLAEFWRLEKEAEKMLERLAN